MNLLTPSCVAASDILSCVSWKNTKTFQAIAAKETQLKHYKRMGASAEVLQLVELESKPFGSVAEKMMCEIFGLGPRTSTQNDASLDGVKIEIKCARYWAGKDECVWQHLEEDHDYDYAMFAVLDFHGWKVWGIHKSVLMGELRDKKIVTKQGKQGFWTSKSAVLPYMTQINTIDDLMRGIRSPLNNLPNVSLGAVKATDTNEPLAMALQVCTAVKTTDTNEPLAMALQVCTGVASEFACAIVNSEQQALEKRIAASIPLTEGGV